ncbi:hypothetical protein UFOVP1229_66 [uncultured Caudovirales phage]|uniref:HD domain containing protein n=1 Tax=uncultured Caudovirales phage TaxID=2100421 RepID=A0A6J5RBA0_9CAUD|nr:hypothetical protein UFOVP1229_66 [uncultured Caudovirales phage]
MEEVNNFGCVNSTIRLRSGLYFDLANPDPQTVRISDIAGALSKIPRFGGQADVNFVRESGGAAVFYDRAYSVAEHSFLCALRASDDELPIECVRAVFLHDATEAYVGDMVRPLKCMIPQFREIEKRVSDAIAVAFGVDFDRWHVEIKEIDNAMVIAERNALFTPDGVEWNGESTCRSLNPEFDFLLPMEAERCFTRVFERLFSGVTNVSV